MMRKELTAFLVVGSTTVGVDYLSYSLLLAWGAPIGTSKAVGFLMGTVFAYVANKTWTFGHRQHDKGNAWRFALLYACTLGANVAINGAVLHWLGPNVMNKQIAFVMATGVSAVLNFFGMKLFVFKSAQSRQASA